MKKNIILILFVLITLIIVIPNVIYLAQNKTVENFETYFSFFTNNSIISVILFLIVFIGLSITYIFLIKKYEKIFNKNKAFIFILIISILFTIILPMTSSDIFYYIGTGWQEVKYNQNPYYSSMAQIEEQDIIIETAPDAWKGQTVVYAPLWALISKFIMSLSFGNINIALIIFKIFSLSLHIINCFIIFKITKNIKYVLIYGLNPFILFNFLSNVHNDIYIVSLILLALYFFRNKDNLFLTVVFLGLAASIKYITILLLPFIILYYYRKENIFKKIGYCFLFGILFILILIMPFFLYMKDTSIFLSVFAQQEKYKQSISLLLILYSKNQILVGNIIRSFQLIFVVSYIALVIRYLFKKDFEFEDIIKKYTWLLIYFIFIYLTSFCNWYIIWLFPTLIFLDEKIQKSIIYISLASEISNVVFFYFGEDDLNFARIYILLGIKIFLIMLLLENLKIKGKKIEKVISN